jgi:hypothetical protein
MTPEILTYWEYVKAAFHYRPRIPLLGKMPVNAMALAAFGILGFLFSPGFWLLGAALELGYLGFLSGNPSFQKVVQGERLLQRQQGYDQKVQALAAALSKESAARYRQLVDRCGHVLGIEADADQSGILRDMRGGSLSQLLWLFLRLLSSRELILQTLSQVDSRRVEDDVKKLKDRLATKAEADSPLVRSLQATLDIQSKRLENLGRSRANLEVIDAELERIEQQVHLLQEESATSGGPQFLSARIDAVTSTLSETSQWMDQHAEFFSSLAGEDSEPTAAPIPRSSGTAQKQ